jgi:hypothetical protein
VEDDSVLDELFFEERGKWKERSDNLAVGDIVKICDDCVRRGDWPIR